MVSFIFLFYSVLVPTHVMGPVTFHVVGWIFNSLDKCFIDPHSLVSHCLIDGSKSSLIGNKSQLSYCGNITGRWDPCIIYIDLTRLGSFSSKIPFIIILSQMTAVNITISIRFSSILSPGVSSSQRNFLERENTT